MFGERLAVALGQPVVVENRGGAGGLAGAAAGAKSAPDGQTLVLGSDYAFTIYPQLAKTPYDPVKGFVPVGLIANVPMVLVVNHNRVGARNIKELIALAKANPGKFSIASPETVPPIIWRRSTSSIRLASSCRMFPTRVRHRR
ncbi:conserved hypothetical protein [Cupriavidus necator]|uniref:Extra-cytoplasmic solute receptor n=1 Tax=Cupriavidus necator TaxID=106590 RepID=A0A1K0IHX3_CUPNE|nr:conserved hypothetical protein [Cupriavidus necator]